MNIINIECNPLYLLAILNSKAVSFWFAHKFGKLQRGLFPQFKINELSLFPIPKANKETENKLANLVKEIIEKKKGDVSADIKKEDNEIDNIVYNLFGLSQTEIKTIEGIN